MITSQTLFINPTRSILAYAPIKTSVPLLMMVTLSTYKYSSKKTLVVIVCPNSLDLKGTGKV